MFLHLVLNYLNLPILEKIKVGMQMHILVVAVFLYHSGAVHLSLMPSLVANAILYLEHIESNLIKFGRRQHSMEEETENCGLPCHPQICPLPIAQAVTSILVC